MRATLALLVLSGCVGMADGPEPDAGSSTGGGSAGGTAGGSAGGTAGGSAGGTAGGSAGGTAGGGVIPMGNNLAMLAASMPAGTWAKLNVPTQDAIIGSQPGASGSLIHFSNSVPWNPRSKKIEIVASDHLGSTPGMQQVEFDAATNQFSQVIAAPAVPGIGHGYDHNSVNPFTGDLYHRLYSGFTGTIRVFRKTFGAASLTQLTTVSASDQVAVGSCWWSGTLMGAGAQGALVIYNSGNSTGSASDGQILAYDPLAGTWFMNQTGMAPNSGSGSTYHSVIEYSAVKNVAVYGGGNAAPRKLWRMSSNGSHVAMPDAPGATAVGEQAGNFVADPVTGNFLLLSAGQLWELDPGGSGTWTQQTAARAPPMGVGVPGPSQPEGVVSSSISDYGVVAYLTQSSASGGTFYLYKHAN